MSLQDPVFKMSLQDPAFKIYPRRILSLRYPCSILPRSLRILPLRCPYRIFKDSIRILTRAAGLIEQYCYLKWSHPFDLIKVLISTPELACTYMQHCTCTCMYSQGNVCNFKDVSILYLHVRLEMFTSKSDCLYSLF